MNKRIILILISNVITHKTYNLAWCCERYNIPLIFCKLFDHLFRMLKIVVIAVCIQLGRARYTLDYDMPNDIRGEPVRSTRNKVWVELSQKPVSRVTKKEGSFMELECEAMGSPPPSIQWFKDNRPITILNEKYENNIISEESQGLAKIQSRLIINYLLPVHEGHYRCQAQTEGRVVTANTKVIVLDKNTIKMNLTDLVRSNILGNYHKPRITLWNPTYMEHIGREIILPCETSGNPKPDIIWENPQGQEIESESEDNITVLVGGELRIEKISWEDMGVYKCHSRNSMGEDVVETFLYPMQ